MAMARGRPPALLGSSGHQGVPRTGVYFLWMMPSEGLATRALIFNSGALCKNNQDFLSKQRDKQISRLKGEKSGCGEEPWLSQLETGASGKAVSVLHSQPVKKSARPRTEQ